MTADEGVKCAWEVLEGKLIDLGWATQARDPALRSQIEATLGQFLAQSPAGAPPPAAPDLADADLAITNIATLLQLQRDQAGADEPVFSVFLGAGAHFGPPQYVAPEVAAGYPATVRPPVGSALAEILAKQCEYAAAFPHESSTDWMRVAAWHERKNNRGGPLGLESRIKAAVQTGKQGSSMIQEVASWPCRNFYTTNFDAHLEHALLQSREELYVWVYTPKASDLRQCWWRMDKTHKLTKWADAWVTPNPSGGPPPPPADATVVFKLHGDVEVPGSLVITEDDYIKFLRRIARQKLPTRLLLPLARTLVFIGYSLRDFNMRYVLSLLREERDTNWENPEMSYSIDLRPDPLIKEIWKNRDNLITFIEHNLWDIIPAVGKRFQPSPTPAPPVP